MTAVPYTIGEFARLLGLGADTLRYYEKAGLILPGRNPANNYRQYSDALALRAMNLRMYRSLGMDLAAMKAVAAGRSVREQNEDLTRERERIAAEIRRLESKARRIDELKVFYDLAEHETGRVNEIEMEASHSLYVFGPDARRGPKALQTVRKWMRHLPYSYFSVGISRDSLLSGDEGLEMRLGVGVLERYRKALGLALSPEVETFPAGRSVSMHLASRDFFGLSKRDIAPLYAYARERGCRIASEATGRTFAEETADGRPLYHFSIRVRMEQSP